MSRRSRIALPLTVALLAAGGLVATLADEPPYKEIYPAYLAGPQVKYFELNYDAPKLGTPGLPPGTRPIAPAPPSTNPTLPQGGKNLAGLSKGIGLAGSLDAGSASPEQRLEARLKTLAHDLR